MSDIQDQPAPKPGRGLSIWELVIEDMTSGEAPFTAFSPLIISDMRDRDATGRVRYGVPLRAHNGRDALVDAYQEALDCCVYLKQWCVEQGPRADASRYWDALRLAISLRRVLSERQKNEAARSILSGRAPHLDCDCYACRPGT